MPRDEEDVRQLVERLGVGLRDAGVRVTHQRLEIFREVAKSGGHPDVETVFRGVRKRVPTVSLDTVYRALWLFTDLGLITTLSLPRERLRFDANMKPHHHFVCTKCGMASDFYSEELDHLRLPGSVRDLGVVQKMQVEVRGLCRDCAEGTDPTQRTQRKEEEL